MPGRVGRELVLFQHVLGWYSLDHAFRGAHVEGHSGLGHSCCLSSSLALGRVSFPSGTSGAGPLILSYVGRSLSPTASPWIWEQVRKAAGMVLTQPTNL